MDSTIGQVTIDEQGEPTLLIHYAYGTGKWSFVRGSKVPKIVVACQPDAEVFRGQHSNDVRAVNCPVCRQTEAFLIDSEPAEEREDWLHFFVQGRVACNGRGRYSDEVRVVDCPRCLRTGAAKKAVEEVMRVVRK